MSPPPARHTAVELAATALSVLSLLPILWVELEGLRWPDPRFQVVAAVDLAIVAVLAAELVWRLVRAPSRRAFLRRHWWEAVALVPLYAESVSFLRVTRLLRLGRALRLLLLFRSLRRLRVLRFLDAAFNGSGLGITLMASLGVVFTMALTVWVLERDTNPALSDFHDALWWAVVTSTTVGYGDITPNTGAGRLVATALMLVGIGLIGMVASSLSHAFLALSARRRPHARRDLVEQLERLARLHRDGALDDEEFAAAKRAVLGQP